MGPVLGKLVRSIFDKKRMTPHSVFSPGFMVATVLFTLMKTVKLLFFVNLGLDVGRDMGRNYIFPWQSTGDGHNII